MRTEELLIILLIGGVVLLVPLIAIVLSIMAILRTRRLAELTSRLNGIETYLRNAANGMAVQPLKRSSEAQRQDLSEISEAVATIQTTVMPDMQSPGPADASLKNAAAAVSLRPESASSEITPASPVGWETFIGQKAFG